MEILIIFANISENKTTISLDSLSNIRLILSLFQEEIISDDEFNQELENLIEEGYLSKSRSEEFEVTPRGSTIVKSIGRTLLGESEYDRLTHSILDYTNSKGKPKYIRMLGDRLNKLQQAKANKTRNVDPNSVHPLGILIKIQHNIEQLFTSEFNLIADHLKDNKIFENEKKNLQNKLSRQYNIPIIVLRSGNTLLVTGPIRIESISFFNTILSSVKCYPTERRKIPQWNNVILYHFVEKALRKIGFLPSGQFTFTNYSNCKQHEENSGYLECDAIKLSFIDLKNDTVFVFVESYQSILHSLLQFIAVNLKSGTSRDAIIDKIKKLKLRVIPFGRRINFIDLAWDKDLSHEKIPDSMKTYCEYWEDTHGILISQIIQPIIITQAFNRSLSYPAEMINIDKLSIEQAYGNVPKRKPRYEDLDERFNKIKYLSSFKSYRDENTEKFFKLNIIENSPSLKTLIDLNGFKGTVQISPPLLEFSRGAFSIDPLDVFNHEFGPVCGKKNLVITHILTHVSISDRQIDIFCDAISRAFNIFNFGTISKNPGAKIKKFDSITNLNALENKVREFEPLNNSNAIGIAIIPDDSSFYYSLKNMFPVKTGTRLQIVKMSSFDKIISSNFPGMKLLSSKYFY